MCPTGSTNGFFFCRACTAAVYLRQLKHPPRVCLPGLSINSVPCAILLYAASITAVVLKRLLLFRSGTREWRASCVIHGCNVRQKSTHPASTWPIDQLCSCASFELSFIGLPSNLIDSTHEMCRPVALKATRRPADDLLEDRRGSVPILINYE